METYVYLKEGKVEVYIEGEWFRHDPYVVIERLERENIELRAEIHTLKAMMRIK